MFVYFIGIFKEATLMTSSIVTLFSIWLIPGPFLMISSYFLWIYSVLYFEFGGQSLDFSFSPSNMCFCGHTPGSCSLPYRV